MFGRGLQRQERMECVHIARFAGRLCPVDLQFTFLSCSPFPVIPNDCAANAEQSIWNPASSSLYAEAGFQLAPPFRFAQFRLGWNDHTYDFAAAISSSASMIFAGSSD
jgi:hypothetical protein